MYTIIRQVGGWRSLTRWEFPAKVPIPYSSGKLRNVTEPGLLEQFHVFVISPSVGLKIKSEFFPTQFGHAGKHPPFCYSIEKRSRGGRFVRSKS